MIFFVAMPLRDRPDELRRAAADRRARRGVPVPEQLLVLDDHHGRHAGHGSLFVGEFAVPAGWPIPPLSGILAQSRTSGSTTTSGRCRSPASARCPGVNLIATIVKMRAPGMT
jgi:hypothetical protein